MPATKAPSKREFDVGPTQYQLFRFNVRKPTPLHVRLIATAPVNLLLLDDEDRTEYQDGKLNHTYTAAWGRRKYLEASVDVEPGTWYLIVEGSTEPSRPRGAVRRR